MRYTFLFTFLCLTVPLFAQNILMEKETEKLYEVSETGPNLKHFLHLYTGGSFYAGSSSDIKPFYSGDFLVGLRYKRKISPLIATGSSLYWRNATYQYKEDPEIIDEGTFLDKEKLIFNSLGSEMYMRINFDPDRGNYVGNFIDIGAYGEWIFSDAYKTFKEGSFSLFNKQKTVYRGLKKTRNFGYGALLRMARNKYVFFIHYRLSDYFKNDLNEPERIVVGVQIGLHK